MTSSSPPPLPALGICLEEYEQFFATFLPFLAS
jgi:hypothetical protein